MYPAYQAPGSYGIPAEAANLEYSILSAILGASPDSGSGGSPATTHAPPVASTSYAPAQSSGLAAAAWPAEPAGQYTQNQAGGAQGYTGAGGPGYGEQQPPLALPPSDTTYPAPSAGGVPPEYITPAATTGYSAMYPPQAGPGASAQYADYAADQSQAQAQGSSAGAYPSSSAVTQSPPSSFLSRPRRNNPSSPTAARMVPNWAGSPISAQAITAGEGAGAVQSVYKSVTKGYDYTQGYHFLMKHLSRRCVFPIRACAGEMLMVCGCVFLSVCEPSSVVGAYVCPFVLPFRSYPGLYAISAPLPSVAFIRAPPPRVPSSSRFDKNDILRIVRALAIVRPSFIALQMPMSEEDEVFVEKCFQRSLIELDKLVSFSGTPTVAWRRTGEICLVGPEFCMLTGWEREELVGRRKYIYEVRTNLLWPGIGMGLTRGGCHSCSKTSRWWSTGRTSRTTRSKTQPSPCTRTVCCSNRAARPSPAHSASPSAAILWTSPVSS